MTSARFSQVLAACVAGASMLAPAWAQDAIAGVSKSSIDLYAAPDLNAAKKAIAVPTPLGSDWVVLQSKNRFYEIQAGSHGQGWALRSNITVARESNFVEPCRIAGGERSGVIGGTAGFSKGC